MYRQSEKSLWNSNTSSTCPEKYGELRHINSLIFSIYQESLCPLYSHEDLCVLLPTKSFRLSEHELTFTFAICYRPFVCRLSVCRLSVIYNARTPYSAGWNFQECFFSSWYLGHPLTFAENFFLRSSQENPSGGRVKWKRGVSNIVILDQGKAISGKRCKIGGKLVLITNRKSYVNFRLVYQNRWPWMTVNGVMALILRYFTEFVNDVVVKELPWFQNLLLIVYDHINTICAIIKRLFEQNKLW